MVCEITMNESCAGPGFALKMGDVLAVGQQIDAAEAVRWVNGRRARVTKGELPGAGEGAQMTRLIGSKAEEPAAANAETIIRRRRV